MKGIIIFNTMNDLVFMDTDEELCQHIQRLAYKDGLLDDSSKVKVIDKNIVMQLFSPLIASYKVMLVQYGNKYKYIESEDGVLLVFNDTLNYITVSICTKDDSISDVQHELSLFNVIIETLYGPSLEKMNICTPVSEDVSRSDLLSLILKKWKYLKMKQQMFLVEAVERLIINPEITALGINLLQEVLEKVRNVHKEAVFSHAFLIVDTKLLALYSSRNSEQLAKEILLLLILIVHTLKISQKEEEEIEKNLADEFLIPISSNLILGEGQGQKKGSLPRKKNLDNTFFKLKPGAQTLLLYLKSRTGILVPHIFYVVEVANNIHLILLSELIQYGTASSLLSSIWKSLHNLQSHPLLRNPVSTFYLLEEEFRSLVDAVWKIKVPFDKERTIKKLVSKWEQLKQCELESFCETSTDKTANPRLDATLSSMCDVIKNVFEEVIAIPCLKYEEETRGDKHQDILLHVQKFSIRRLVDVNDFLQVKAIQNISITSYIPDYPGLIHFIYVDRSCDCLIAPSIPPRKVNANGPVSLKEKVWSMVSRGRRYLDGANKFCCLWKDDDLCFFYNIWFENTSGVVIKPNTYPNLKRFPQKGILCGNFYKRLIKECFPGAAHEHISCYEIFCIHLNSTPYETVVEHSRRLCSQLWDFTGAYRTSLDLL